MSRFFVAPEDVGAEYITIENKEDLHHMKKVLRLKAGDEIDVSDGDMWEYHGKILSLEPEYCQVKILDKQKFSAEPETKITLFQGIPKQGKMELIVQKAVELGACGIVPVFMDRTVVTDKGNFGKKIQRWQKVSNEAVKQCKRGIIPQIEDAIKMPEVIRRFAGFDLVLFPYENEDGTTIKEVLRPLAGGSYEEAGTAAGNAGKLARPENIAIIIGPEGGFDPSEVSMAQEAGAVPMTLGKRILRTETAGLAVLSILMFELEDN